jgi:hypothetical protein
MFPNGEDKVSLEIHINETLIQTIEYKVSDLPPKGEYIEVFSATVPAPAPESYTAIPTNDEFIVDGTQASPFDIIKINGGNCIKIRDAATILAGTTKQFAVDFDVTSRTLYINSAASYISVGGELATIGTESVLATKSTWTLIVDGETTQPEMYTVSGNNYLPLRTLLRLINCAVQYDNGVVYINTATPYNE